MSPPSTLPRPSAPTAGRGRKRPGRCCLRRSSFCCACCTAGSRSATGPNTSRRCFAEVARRVWDTYHAPDRRSFAQRLRSLRQWATGHLTGIVLENVLDLCGKRDRWSIAYRHPGGHRTSNMLDRLMRGMNRYFDQGQHLHGSLEACRLHCRAWAFLCNFTPWHPAVARENQGWRCPAERLSSCPRITSPMS
jgi:hypothetical protein